MVQWCLYLCHLSGTAYEMLRKTGTIKLPSQRTIRDYIHVYHTKATVGFSHEVDQQLKIAAKLPFVCRCRERQVCYSYF